MLAGCRDLLGIDELTMRVLGLFAADALAELAGNALYHGIKRLSRDRRGHKFHKKGAHQQCSH